MKRSMYSSVVSNSASYKGRGRLPTMDISPFRILTNCGSSSMLYLRMIRPTLVIRGSFSNLTKAFFCCFRLFFNNCFSVVRNHRPREESRWFDWKLGRFQYELVGTVFLPGIDLRPRIPSGVYLRPRNGTEFEEIKYVVITSDSFGFIYNRTFLSIRMASAVTIRNGERQTIAVPEKRMSNVLFHQGSLNLRGLF